LTIGQYLSPSKDHLPVTRYVPPEEFDFLAETAKSSGIKKVFSAPLVRSSYHADEQSAG
jgi:lipoic acid synthetase